MKRILAAAAAAALLLLSCPAPAAAAEEDIFFEDFSGTRLDPAKWRIAEKNWGGTVTEDGRTVDYNGGVIAENVAVRGGELVLTGLGNDYAGDLRGIARDGSRRKDGKRCGGAIATADYFASGSYEIRARIAPELGCCSAMWTFEYEEDYSGDTLTVTNHEIDIEFPGRDADDAFSLSHALCTTWVTEEDYLTRSVPCGDQADGAYHTYRFDWHTGSDTETPRVEYYFDDVLTYTSYDHIPTNESRLWLGLWFPRYWAGTPDFETTAFYIDYVKITPFHEEGDTMQHESYPDHGWATPAADLPKGWLLWHSYSTYGAYDSRLFLRAPDGIVTEITGDFYSAMNASFGTSPQQFTFMAKDPATNEWDIFLYDHGTVTDLTKDSDFQNEDPKLSPDGSQIVFKRRIWDGSIGDFVYDLALMDIETRAVTMLTDDAAEDAMPCFSADGRAVFFARYSGEIGSICRLDLATRTVETVYHEEGVNAYYPIVQGDRLYFTKWYSAENRCDQLMCWDGETLTAMPFDSERYDCSDACPIDAEMMVYSSTENGAYSLYLYDGQTSLPLDVNSEQNDLGAAFFPAPRGDVDADGDCDTADVVLLQKWLHHATRTALPDAEAADLDGDGRVDVLDLGLLKRTLLASHDR